MQTDSAFWKVLIGEYFCLISNTHPRETSLALDEKPNLLIYLPEQLSIGWSPQRRDTGKANQLAVFRRLCLSQSLLGLVYFKGNSCLFCLNVFFFF